ncbi:MAG: glycosyltransferase family 2 protein [Chloroflexi bacterium]|nr:glycosyltransferase family 2 protein [Chloroflexota bacterium]
MAVYNGMPYLPKAVDSILEQSFGDLEFLVADDASTDGSATYLASLTDARIRILTNKENLGLSRSLNLGLDVARGDYVARMDHDDLSLPARLAEQVAYMDAHPEIDVCGTWTRTIGLQTEQTWRYPRTDAEIRAEMLFASVIVHSSAMLRRSSFERHNLRYDPKIARAQDYELWVRAAPHLRFANLGKVLLRYRVHVGQVGALHSAEQQVMADQMRAGLLRDLGLKPTASELKRHNAISRWQFETSLEHLDQVEAWLLKLADANRKSARYASLPFAKTLEARWWAACRVNLSSGMASWRRYSSSELARAAGRSPLERTQFWLKALAREWGLRS